MTKLPFSQLNLMPKIERALTEMGLDMATPIQSEAIPLIRMGGDVIARSQTGTGKTIAFAIPAIEKVDTHEEKATIQALILCPTRELVQQAAEEIRKIARFKPGIRPVEIYGGAAIDKQCIRLRRANIVIGTPGRMIDHIHRKTIKLSQVKMVVLDEADEMLNMGFKEDIEAILKNTPENRQTVLFSATMPSGIVKLTQEFQTHPQLIEINKEQVTIENIKQSFIDVPHNKKKDALITLLQFRDPKRAIIFSNTKRMVDELTELLLSHHFCVESIHSDIKQSQRTAVMQGFKQGRTSILIATDIAARGIDVSDVDFVINFDIPVNSEYYIHRIGRTGRAGKSGYAITLCSGRREVSAMRNIALDTKSVVTKAELPTNDEMKMLQSNQLLLAMEKALHCKPQHIYSELVNQLIERGFSIQSIAEAALRLYFNNGTFASALPNVGLPGNKSMLKEKGITAHSKILPIQFKKLSIDIGSNQHVTANHIIGALTERLDLASSDIGKVEIFSNHCIIEISSGLFNEMIQSMTGCKINGKFVKMEPLSEPIQIRKRPSNDHNPSPKKAVR